jgi:hypothetical protein
MTSLLRFEPLQVAHLDELADVLLHDSVYEHIETVLPSVDEFKLGLTIAIAGPRANQAGQTWLNYLIRDESSGSMLGWLESTVHDAVAEVAFLLGPRHWGRGHASRGLAWLEAEVVRRCSVHDFWAAITPGNDRSRALLERSGYVPIHGQTPTLFSHEPGDLVFHKSLPPCAI